MIHAAKDFRRAFDSLELQDPLYTFKPTYQEWGRVDVMCNLLEVFYSATNVVSGTKYPTANLYFHEIWEVKQRLEREIGRLEERVQSTQERLAAGHEVDEVELETQNQFLAMVKYMLKKFNKYWDMSWMTLSIPVILDPQFKLSFLEYRFVHAFGSLVAASKVSVVKKMFEGLYMEYAQLDNSFEPTQQRSEDVDMDINGSDKFADWDQHVSLSPPTSTFSLELETYLAKRPIPRVKDFDILKWWQSNSIKFPTLGRMAQDILAVPASTVASESAFSTGSRVVSDFRSSLAPETVEALVCLQDWMRSSCSSQLSMESVQNIIGPHNQALNL